MTTLCEFYDDDAEFSFACITKDLVETTYMHNCAYCGGLNGHGVLHQFTEWEGINNLGETKQISQKLCMFCATLFDDSDIEVIFDDAMDFQEAILENIDSMNPSELRDTRATIDAWHKDLREEFTRKFADVVNRLWENSK